MFCVFIMILGQTGSSDVFSDFKEHVKEIKMLHLFLGLLLVKRKVFFSRVCSFWITQIRINDPRSLRSRCIKETDESTLGKVSSVPLMNHDSNDLGSLILICIVPKNGAPKLSLH